MPFLLPFLATIALVGQLAFGQSENVEALTAQAEITPYKLSPHQNVVLKINLNLLPGYKAYADQFKVQIIQPEGFQIGKIELNPIQQFYDKFTKKNRTGITGQANLTATLEAPSAFQEKSGSCEIELTYQACTSTTCLFPTTIKIFAPYELVNTGPTADVTTKKSETNQILPLDFNQAFAKGLLWTFVFVFIAGVLTSFTPCIFPMIPITLSVLGRNAHTRSRLQNFAVSNLYVFGIACTYAVMGVVAASTGALFGSFMSHPIVLSVMCLVFIAMALSMFGLFELQAPAFIQNRFATSSDMTGYSGAFFSGVVAGVVASPCVGPVLVGILTFIAKTQNLWLGFFLMFVYALGMGQIFLVLGLFSQLTKVLPKSGPWLDGVKYFFGLLMLGVSYYFLSLLLPQRIWDIAFGLGLAGISGYFGAFSTANTISNWIKKGVLQALTILAGAYFIIGCFDLRPLLQPKLVHQIKSDGSQQRTSTWKKFSPELLLSAKQESKPVIVDFGADWCAACKELEQFTFSAKPFLSLADQFVLLKFDATESTPELDSLREKYEIIGLPTLLFFNRNGDLQKDLTLTAFENGEDFSKRMKTALGR